MARTVREIALDIKAAVETAAKAVAAAGQAAGGPPPPPGAKPRIEVRLDDGRVVEIGALADELLALSDEDSQA